MARSVVVNARFLSQPITGVQRFAQEISRELKQIHGGVRFVCPQDVLREDVANELDVIRVGRLKGHSWEQLELPRYLHSHGSPLLLNLGSTGPMGYGDQIVTHHDITYVRHPESFSRSFRLLYGMLIPRLLKSSRAVITVSEFSKGELTKHFGVDASKISVIPNAVDARFAPGAPPEQAPFVLAVSSPNAHKNFQRLLDAFGEISEDVSVDLKIVGGSASSFRKQVYQARNRGVRIHFLGRCSDEELIGLYQQASAFVFPSLYEGFGIPPLEAQACACPVVASDIPPVREVLGGSAAYFDPRDTSSIAKAITDVVSDPTRSGALSALGLQNVQRYSWRNSAKKVADLLGRLG